MLVNLSTSAPAWPDLISLLLNSLVLESGSPTLSHVTGGIDSRSADPTGAFPGQMTSIREAELLEFGISPNILFCLAREPVHSELLFWHVKIVANVR